ncbi:MAG TPA: sulfite exporter TauE/SafE family protein [Solirubrobacteraceae bacterium]|nr:sulfite exporter TauE/SafE family protein [Solirubrobacteraceae bacterium]
MQTLLAVAGAMALGIAFQSAVGFGGSLVAAPLLSLILQPVQVVALLLATALLVGPAILAEPGQRGRIAAGDAALLLAAAVAGLPVGVLAVGALDTRSLQAAVAVVILLTLAGQRLQPARTGPRSGVLAGFAAGVLTTATSLNGPPLVLWLRGRGHPPEVFRATMTAVFLPVSAVGLIALLAGHPPDLGLDVLAAAFAGSAAGWLAGRSVFARLRPAAHARAVTGLLLATAAASLAAAAGAT